MVWMQHVFIHSISFAFWRFLSFSSEGFLHQTVNGHAPGDSLLFIPRSESLKISFWRRLLFRQWRLLPCQRLTCHCVFTELTEIKHRSATKVNIFSERNSVSLSNRLRFSFLFFFFFWANISVCSCFTVKVWIIYLTRKIFIFISLQRKWASRERFLFTDMQIHWICSYTYILWLIQFSYIHYIIFCPCSSLCRVCGVIVFWLVLSIIKRKYLGYKYGSDLLTRPE